MTDHSKLYKFNESRRSAIDSRWWNFGLGQPLFVFRYVVCAWCVMFAALTVASAAERVFYAGGAGDELFYDATRLSDGRWLIAGRASALDWLPANTPVTVAAGTAAITSPNSTGAWIGFILVVSPDLGTIERCWHLPKGAAENIRRIRTTEVPGAATGEIFISGNIALNSWGDAQGGYFVAKLSGNFLAGPPAGLAWAVNEKAAGDLKENQAWDVGAAGGDILLITVTGKPHSADWMAANFYNGAGQPKSLAALHAKDAYRLVLKTNSTGDFRSWSPSDFAAVDGDTNGGLRRGRWPMDTFFDGPYNLPGNGSGRGYTGYSNAATAGHISAVTVDRRSNAFYLGANIKTKLPDGNPDFEPWVSAYAADGTARWWTRLYSEWKDSTSGVNKNGLIDLDLDTNGDNVPDRSSEGINSSPDQYVDGLALDYVGNRLVVNARCHGNNVSNFWSGTAASIPGAPAGYVGFQKQFTGTSGNIHISWLGTFSISDGTLRGATYVAGFARNGTVNASPSSDPNLGGWSNPNSGWPNLNTTRLRPGRMVVDPSGRVMIIGTAPRLATTITAWQTVPPPPATSPWHDFANVYSPDLSTLIYGTAICGQFTYPGDDTLVEPVGAQGVSVQGIVPASGGFLVLAGSSAMGGVPEGNPLRVGDAPSWARFGRGATDGIIARLFLRGEASTPFTAWRLAELGSIGADPFADPDGDGLANLMEYALGRPPLTATGAGTALNEGFANFPSGKAWVMNLRRDPARNDITLEVQVSSDLAEWTTVATSMAGAPFGGVGYVGGDDASPGIKTVELRDPSPDASSSRFMRLRVTW